jgi:hypothetical protein
LHVERLAESLPDLLVSADGGLPALEVDAGADLIGRVDDVLDETGGPDVDVRPSGGPPGLRVWAQNRRGRVAVAQYQWWACQNAQARTGDP